VALLFDHIDGTFLLRAVGLHGDLTIDIALILRWLGAFKEERRRHQRPP
jgi:hypothetical protein